MNVLIINSSNRINGNTAIALKRYNDILTGNNYKTHIINLSKNNIKTCLGCRICFDKGEQNCPLNDDVKNIVKQMENTEILLCGSPIYVEDINGILKNFIDRLAYNSHRPAFAGKYAYVLCTSGMGTSNHGITTMERALQTWGFTIIGSAKYVTDAKISEKEFIKLYETKVHKGFKNIVKKINKNKKRVSFLSILFFTVQQFYYRKKTDKNSFDYKYWENKGWINKNKHYYTEQKLNWVKVLIAEILTVIITKIVLK